MKDDLNELFRLAARFFLKKYKAQGGSQKKLAKELGVSQAYLSTILRGSKSASIDLYSRIASRLYGPLDKFIGVGRRIKNGLEPLEKEEPEIKSSEQEGVESLIARLTHYVVEHQRTEKKLEQLTEHYKLIMENIQTGVLVMNRDHVVTFANKHMEELSNLTVDKIVGTSPLRVDKQIPEIDICEFTQKYKEAAKKLDKTFFRDLVLEVPRENLRYDSGWMIPLIHDDQFDGMICTVWDNTTSYSLSKVLMLTLDHDQRGIGIAVQSKPGAPLEIYFLNKTFKKIFSMPKFDTFASPFDEALLKVKKCLVNSDEWHKFCLANIANGSKARKMTVEHVNGRKYLWESKPLTDSGKHWGRIVIISEIGGQRDSKT